MGGKPNPATKKDRRLKANKATAPAAKLKFGSPAWQAKYGTGKKK